MNFVLRGTVLWCAGICCRDYSTLLSTLGNAPFLSSKKCLCPLQRVASDQGSDPSSWCFVTLCGPCALWGQQFMFVHCLLRAKCFSHVIAFTPPTSPLLQNYIVQMREGVAKSLDRCPRSAREVINTTLLLPQAERARRASPLCFTALFWEIFRGGAFSQ